MAGGKVGEKLLTLSVSQATRLRPGSRGRGGGEPLSFPCLFHDLFLDVADRPTRPRWNSPVCFSRENTCPRAGSGLLPIPFRQRRNSFYAACLSVLPFALPYGLALLPASVEFSRGSLDNADNVWWSDVAQLLQRDEWNFLLLRFSSLFLKVVYGRINFAH